MKKILIIIAIIICVIISNKDESIIIPNNAIRYRVIASSNSIEDQLIKNNLSKELENYLYDLTKNAISFENSKSILMKKQGEIDNFIESYLKKNNIDETFKLTIGKNYFPEKTYKGINYEAGYYDSVVVNLGKGSGINWWCVIYPPLCLIDEKTDDVEYTTLVSELLDNYNM